MVQSQNILASALSASLLLSIGACVGSIPADGEPDAAKPDAGEPTTVAERQFVEEVQPVLSACASCHAGTADSPLKFLGADPAGDYYNDIVRHPSVTGGFDSALANMLTYIEGQDHYGMAYSDSDSRAIRSWLETEKTDLCTTSPNSPVCAPDEPDEPEEPSCITDATLLYQTWAGCMTQSDFLQSQMNRWDNKPADGDTCETCHGGGLARFNTADDNTEMFNMNRTHLYVVGFFTQAVDGQGCATIIPAYDKLNLVGNNATNGTHPDYTTGLNDQYYGYLEDFYQRTQTRMDEGNCGPPGFYQP